MKLASLLNHISVGGRVCRGRIRSSNIWGPSLSGTEFVRGRDVPESESLKKKCVNNHIVVVVVSGIQPEKAQLPKLWRGPPR